MLYPFLFNSFHTFTSDGLAATGNAPRMFLITLKNGLPIISILTCASFGLLAYMSVDEVAGKVFGWFANLAAVAGT